MEPRGVTLKKAGELIGGDKPLSVRTVSAMIARGDLEAYGERKGRRVTTRSIRAYQDGKQWRDESENDGGPALATLPRPKTKRGSRSTHDLAAVTTSDVVSIVAHLPRRGSTR